MTQAKQIYKKISGNYEWYLKNIFRSLQEDAKSVLFNEEKINDKLLKKLGKSKYNKDKRICSFSEVCRKQWKEKRKTLKKLVLLRKETT